MKTKSIVMILMFCFIGAVCLAANANMGTWKLNETKSKLSPAVGKNTMVVYVAEGDNVKIIVDGLDPMGKPAHNEWVGKFDGKDYPVTGDPNADARSYTSVDDNTLHATNKKGSKSTADIQIVVSADGKTRTVTVATMDLKGNKVNTTSVYDRQ